MDTSTLDGQCNFDQISQETSAEKVCSICLLPLYDGLALPCDHTFHDSCVAEWLKRNNTCPLCRTIVDSYKKETKCKICNKIMPCNEGDENMLYCPMCTHLLTPVRMYVIRL